ncbi:MAG: metal ABC transporter permease, partial [Deinococcus sp.]|nr:metal ABC transporter permease [Deinococcus sp.]
MSQAVPSIVGRPGVSKTLPLLGLVALVAIGIVVFQEALAVPLAFEFFRMGLLAAALVGLLLAVVGAFVIMQNLAFLGSGVAYSAFVGAVIGALTPLGLPLGAAIVGVLSALGINYVTRRAKVSSDTSISIIFTAAFALGVVISVV